MTIRNKWSIKNKHILVTEERKKIHQAKYLVKDKIFETHNRMSQLGLRSKTVQLMFCQCFLPQKLAANEIQLFGNYNQKHLNSNCH